jgi:hypothetical protein
MHPIIHRDLAQARIADLHRQAQRDAQARVASAARRAQAPQRRHPVRGLPSAIAQRLLAGLGAGSA